MTFKSGGTSIEEGKQERKNAHTLTQNIVLSLVLYNNSLKCQPNLYISFVKTITQLPPKCQTYRNSFVPIVSCINNIL